MTSAIPADMRKEALTSVRARFSLSRRLLTSRAHGCSQGSDDDLLPTNLEGWREAIAAGVAATVQSLLSDTAAVGRFLSKHWAEVADLEVTRPANATVGATMADLLIDGLSSQLRQDLAKDPQVLAMFARQFEGCGRREIAGLLDEARSWLGEYAANNLVDPVNLCDHLEVMAGRLRKPDCRVDDQLFSQLQTLVTMTEGKITQGAGGAMTATAVRLVAAADWTFFCRQHPEFAPDDLDFSGRKAKVEDSEAPTP